MKNENFQRTNNNVSKFTSNKTHAYIAKLQVFKFTSFKINHKSQITNSQIHLQYYNIYIYII
jgi:hypothetical protein